MGKPTAAESSQLNLMTNVAQKLRDNQADQATRDQALAMLLEVYVAERDLGLVSVTECEKFRADKNGAGGWNLYKAAAFLGSVLTVTGGLCGTLIKIFT